MLNIHNAEFITSASSPADFVPDDGIEIAFGGRSNAGKSTALNAICARKNLARTSKTPGRTQLINFFAIGDNIRLVDLPGYGFAKADRNRQQHWSRLIEQYYRRRECLAGTMLLMDIRHPFKESDIKMMEWCDYCRCPVHILLTKCDKLSRNQANSTLMNIRKRYDSRYISTQLFSGLKHIGVNEALSVMQQWIAQKTSPEAC